MPGPARPAKVWQAGIIRSHACLWNGPTRCSDSAALSELDGMAVAEIVLHMTGPCRSNDDKKTGKIWSHVLAQPHTGQCILLIHESQAGL